MTKLKRFKKVDSEGYATAEKANCGYLVWTWFTNATARCHITENLKEASDMISDFTRTETILTSETDCYERVQET